MAEVFINYRTGDGDEAAEFLASRLSDRFGKEHVFKASHSIQPGEMFPKALIDAARKSHVLLAVMGPDWEAAPQLREEADWVRMEILAAQTTGTRVVPVIKGRKTDRLARASLPPELMWLADVHSLRLDMNESTDDLTRIGDFLADLVPTLKAADRMAGEPAASGATDNSAGDVTGNLVQGRDISGGVHTFKLGDSAGPAMLGDHNTQHNLNVLAENLKRLQPIRQPIDHLRWLADRFVPPPGFAEAQAAIRERGTVVLLGSPGAGRTAAAQMLVFNTWSGQGDLHELDPQEPDEGSSFYIDPDLIGRDDGMWVDLSGASQQRWSQVQKELPVLHSRVQERNARLVVIQPHELDLRADFRPYVKRIASPRREEVFGHLLNVEGLANGADLPTPDFLKSPRSMDDIRRFVDDILYARDQQADTADKADLQRWIAAAEQPTSPRETPVSEALTKLTLASQRALLLSVAMLHGAHADVINGAAAALMASLPGEPDAALNRPPLGERLREVGAETDAARNVHFTSSGYEAAVRLFFWRHFPELHDILATWVRTTLGSNVLSLDERVEMARGFAAQCLGARYQRYWTDVVEHLTAQPSNPASELAAAAILRVGLADEANSRTFRRQIYDWSRASDTSGNLATVLVVACQQMTQTHPAEALVRLHHLARRHKRTDIWDALADVVYGNGPLLRLLLSRLTDRPIETTRIVDARIFLHVADPGRLTVRQPTSQPLIAQSDVSRQLAAGWTLAFTRLPGTGWASRASDWLRCAAEDDTSRHLLLNALIEGGRPASAVLPQLYGLAHRAPFRDVIADLVLNQISAVQGVELP
ncbi:MAG: toll/interleukin-1 receptor domain-containing protein [Streptosporangiaceae bacterium]|nr:toll/interleukin-1 receptor domain-containing protein [Streptosporangiaceae bacterium]